jgi:hypothetical protein
MKKLLLFALMTIGAGAFADSTAVCTFGEKYLNLTLNDGGQPVAASWSNPDWGGAGEPRAIDLRYVTYTGNEAAISGYPLQDANGPYVCH